MAVTAPATRRILVVDDDPAIRRMLERTLQAEGYDTRTAPDGGAALAIAESWPPQAIVLDVVMPGIDGHAVARRLRHKGDAVPILLLTARDEVTDRVAGLDAGADDYLVKPFAPDELAARLRALLRRGNPPQSGPVSHGDLTSTPPPAPPPGPARASRSPAARPLCSPCSSATPARSSAATRPSPPSGATAACPPPTPSTATSPICAASSARRR
jgi:CheY-like chemotaxis protein